MYFDEDLLLDIRLNTLNNFVKKFVIAEATYTHNGTPKKLKFDINKFGKFKDKIDYVVVDKEPKNILNLTESDSKERRGEKLILNGMARDYFQRENLSKGIEKANDEDLIFISDLDEIPNFQNLEFSKINNELLNLLYKYYSKAIPTLGKYIVGSSKPYEYLINSIDAFYNQEQLLKLIAANGFINVEYRNLSNGISAIHSGWKI